MGIESLLLICKQNSKPSHIWSLELAVALSTDRSPAVVELPRSENYDSSHTRIVLLALSVISLVICVVGATAHYRKASWGDPWQPIGWLLSMLFLLAAFTASPRELAGRFKSLVNPKAAFFLFWILFFVISHLWNFRTAPWNGDALFDESGWDLWYLKSYVIGHPYQPAWFHIVISRETLFHYYVWGFLKLFGFNILSYEAALFVIWFTTFLFTLLLVDLFFALILSPRLRRWFLIFCRLHSFTPSPGTGTRWRWL